ncbi:response regulator [Chloroflexota bacterium]
MVETKLERLLAEAKNAFEAQDRRKGGRLINQILQLDFTNPTAWEILHRVYGGQRPLQDFQVKFAQRYYPDKVDLLNAAGETEIPEPQTKKPSLFGRLLGALKRVMRPAKPKKKDKEESSMDAPPTSTADGMAAPKHVSLQPIRRPLSSPPQSADQSAPESGYQTAPPPEKITSAPEPGGSQISQSAVSPSPQVDTTGKIRVMIADDIAETRETFARILRFQEDIAVIGTATDGTEAVQMARQLQPDVILMDVNMPDMDGITATATIKKILPSTQVVILTVQDDIDYIRRAMLAGARDYLTKPPTIDDLIQAIQKSSEFAIKEKAKAPPVATFQSPQMAAQGGKVITVYSPRGGAGCTTLATNLAAYLYREEMPVVIVDANLQYGDVPVFFNIQSKNSILDLTLRAGELDPALVKEVATQHSSGIHILAPPPPEFAERVRSDQFAQLLAYLQTRYAYIIIDTPCTLNEVTLSALEISNLVLLVTTQDIPSIARARKFLDLTSMLELDRLRILAVMNQYNSKIKISPQKVGETLGLSLATAIPTEVATVVPSVNRGSPFILQKELSSRPIAIAITETAEAILEQLVKLDEMENAEGEPTQ